MWDAFCAGALNGTFLHTRRFLAYHGSRFMDASALVLDEDRLVAVIPAAVHPTSPSIVVSHPGATYGAIVHDGRVLGGQMLQVIEELRRFYFEAGFRQLIYKAIPHIHCQFPVQDDLYALFRSNAVRTRCDLSCAVDLAQKRPRTERRRRSLKKALRAVTLDEGPGLLPDLYLIMESMLAREHSAKPVHSLEELVLLQTLFPHRILVRGARIEGKLVAGVIFFNAGPAWHVQYSASSEAGYAVFALDAVFDSAMTEAADHGVRWFDFGTSNDNEGWTLNEGLYKFKSEFGGVGVAHETYTLELVK